MKENTEADDRCIPPRWRSTALQVRRKGSFIRCTFRQTCTWITGLWCSLLVLGYGVSASALESPSGVTLQAGKLSVHVGETPLREVLEELSRLNHTPIIWLSSESQWERVSLEFADLPLREGLERILQRQNFVLFYESPSVGTQLRQIWVASNRKEMQPPAPPVAPAQAPSAPEEKEMIVEQKGLVPSPRYQPDVARTTEEGG